MKGGFGRLDPLLYVYNMSNNLSFDEAQAKKGRGRPPKIKDTIYIPDIIDFSGIDRLGNLEIDPRMMETMTSGMVMDQLMSHEGGIPCATNIMCIGDPGVGKTTILLDYLAGIQTAGRKCLFISGEMGKKQMFKYSQRFPQFQILKTLFVSDYTNFNTKDVIEQSLNIGWDLVLIDSAVEIIDGVRDDNGWDRKMAESWLVDVCTQNNKGENDDNKFTSFLLIQQVTKGGLFVGSNKLKHLVDAFMEMRREGVKEGSGSYMKFNKNRNGQVEVKLPYELKTDKIVYSQLLDVKENDKETPTEDLDTEG
jgi:predicted ATP-dependent serine protease